MAKLLTGETVDLITWATKTGRTGILGLLSLATEVAPEDDPAEEVAEDYSNNEPKESEGKELAAIVFASHYILVIFEQNLFASKKFNLFIVVKNLKIQSTLMFRWSAAPEVTEDAPETAVDDAQKAEDLEREGGDGEEQNDNLRPEGDGTVQTAEVCFIYNHELGHSVV